MIPEQAKSNPKYKNIREKLLQSNQKDLYIKTGADTNDSQINNDISKHKIKNIEKNTRQNHQSSSLENYKYDSEELDNSSFSYDNQGRELSPQQQEYFKDSKVRDENGKLLEVYHGTPYEFNTFNYNKLGENTSSLGAGFYFTDNETTGNEYSRGNYLKKVYLDIKKPMKYGKTTITKNEYKKFIEAIDEKTNGVYLEDYDGIENALMEYEYGGDDIDLVNAIHNASGLSWDEIYSLLRETTGYDGVISEKGFLNENETIYVAFNPNQIKNVDNTNPTTNEDIRYSSNNQTWQKFLDDNYKATGKRTNMADIRRNTKNNANNKTKQVMGTDNIKPNPEIAKILEERPVTKEDTDNKLKQLLTIKIVDKGYYVDKLTRQTKNKTLSSTYDYMLMANGITQQSIGNERFNPKTQQYNGKGLHKIFEPIENSGQLQAFSEYMYHKHNVDRMGLEKNIVKKINQCLEIQ